MFTKNSVLNTITGSIFGRYISEYFKMSCATTKCEGLNYKINTPSLYIKKKIYTNNAKTLKY